VSDKFGSTISIGYLVLESLVAKDATL